MKQTGMLTLMLLQDDVNNANIMPPVDLVSNLYIDMLKEIIMCDYNHVDYIPKTDDDLLSLATSVKSRKKVTRLLTKGIEQQCRSSHTTRYKSTL